MTTKEKTRPFPQDHALERDILGALLADNRIVDDLDELRAAHFSHPLHGKAFEIITKRVAAGGLADAATIRHFFSKERDLELWDGINGQTVAEYLSTIDQHAAPRVKIKAYAQTIQDLAKRRAMIMISEDMAAAAYDAPNYDAPEVYIEQAESALYKLKRQGVGAKVVVSLQEAMQEALAATEAANQRGTGLCGLSTGIPALDDALGGLAPGGLYIIAGRPAMGKTALAVNVAYNVASTGGNMGSAAPVGMLSLEMGSTELGQRVLAERANIPAWALRKGDVRGEEQWRSLFQTVKSHADVPFFIDATGGLTIQQAAMRARRMASKHGIGLLVLDYLQLIAGTNQRGGNRVQEMTEVTTSLKALAKELEIPIIALSQLSRAVETRDNKRPMLSDLRESGSIEQDADCVGFVYREAYYLERDKPDPSNGAAVAGWQQQMREAEGKAEVIIAKNRHGPTGTADLAFNAETISFS